MSNKNVPPPKRYISAYQRWFCPNCAELVETIEDSGVAKVRCRKCGLLMTKTHINRRKEMLELVIPHREN